MIVTDQSVTIHKIDHWQDIDLIHLLHCSNLTAKPSERYGVKWRMQMDTILGLFSATAFLIYGTSCLTSLKMKEEFRRYGLDAQRQLTGVLQLLGAIGLLVGIWLFSVIGLIAATGLSLLMLLGFGVRIKIRDSLLQSFPSFFFMVVNAYLSYRFYLMVV